LVRSQALYPNELRVHVTHKIYHFFALKSMSFNGKIEHMSNADKILNVEELASFFGVSDQTIWRWCKSGKIPAFKIGSQWKIRQSDINKVINQKITSKKAENQPKLF